MTLHESCSRTTMALPWLLNGSLSAEERREARDHLIRCAACRKQLELTRVTYEMFRAAENGTSRPQPMSTRKRRMLVRLAQAAAILIVSAAGVSAVWTARHTIKDERAASTRAAATAVRSGHVPDKPMFKEDFEDGRLVGAVQNQPIFRQSFETNAHHGDDWQFRSSKNTRS